MQAFWTYEDFHCAPNFRAALVFRLDPFSTRMVVGPQRVRGDVRTAIGNLGMLAITFGSGAIRWCELHHRLLVHRINFFCEPGSDDCAILVRHVRRDSTVRRSIVHRGTDRGRFMRDLLASLAGPELGGICRPVSCASFLRSRTWRNQLDSRLPGTIA